MHSKSCVCTQSRRTVLGAGCSEMLMARAVDELAGNTKGKESLAIEAFAHALREIPAIIAENAGYDSSELCSHLKAAHYNVCTVLCSVF